VSPSGGLANADPPARRYVPTPSGKILSTGNWPGFPAKFRYFPMLKEIEQLLLLQERDQKIKMFKAELETVPLEQRRIEQFVAAKSNAFDQVRQRNREVEVQRKMLELDAQARRDSIAKYKAQQYQTRKNDEFQAISQEIHRFEKEIERIEDHEIELMEQTEQIQKETAYAELELKAAKRQSELQQADLKKKESTLGERLIQVEGERERLVQGLDPDLLFRYTRLFATKGGNAVVPVEHEFCMGCHMKNTSAQVHRVKLGREIVHCEQCGRILYYAD
jgi:predicted  nucleic acid-binding Zn-ribbon protein